MKNGKIIIISTPSDKTPYLMDVFKNEHRKKSILIKKFPQVGMTALFEHQKGFISETVPIATSWDDSDCDPIKDIKDLLKKDGIE